MNLRHPMGVLHSFSIKNIFYNKMDFVLFIFKWQPPLKRRTYTYFFLQETRL